MFSAREKKVCFILERVQLVVVMATQLIDSAFSLL